MARLTESEVEDVALDWLARLGHQTEDGPALAPDSERPERADYAQVLLVERLRSALSRLNPDLPAGALEDALRRITRPEGPTLEARNRTFHRILVDGVIREHHAVRDDLALYRQLGLAS